MKFGDLCRVKFGDPPTPNSRFSVTLCGPNIPPTPNPALPAHSRWRNRERQWRDSIGSRVLRPLAEGGLGLRIDRGNVAPRLRGVESPRHDLCPASSMSSSLAMSGGDAAVVTEQSPESIDAYYATDGSDRRRGAGGMPLRARISPTVIAPISWPRLAGAPTMRSYPLPGFSFASLAARCSISSGVRGRPSGRRAAPDSLSAGGALERPFQRNELAVPVQDGVGSRDRRVLLEDLASEARRGGARASRTRLRAESDGRRISGSRSERWFVSTEPKCQVNHRVQSDHDEGRRAKWVSSRRSGREGWRRSFRGS